MALSHSLSVLFCKVGMLLLQLIPCCWTHVMTYNIVSLYSCCSPTVAFDSLVFRSTVSSGALSKGHDSLWFWNCAALLPFNSLKERQKASARERVRETYPSLCSVWTAASVVLGVVPFRQSTSTAPMFNGSSAETESEREPETEWNTHYWQKATCTLTEWWIAHN